jgi:hypothetical protein
MHILQYNAFVKIQWLIIQINRVAELENRINLHTTHHQTSEGGRTGTSAKAQVEDTATYNANGSDSEVDYIKQSARVPETQGTSRSEV